MQTKEEEIQKNIFSHKRHWGNLSEEIWQTPT